MMPEKCLAKDLLYSHQSRANRAGTRGFRAPEVLLKCGDQTGGQSICNFIIFRKVTYKFSAVDVWSAGMIMLFFLIEKFPLFRSNDDTEALMEVASIVGRRRMEKAATLHST
jgi:cell division control protein 7